MAVRITIIYDNRALEEGLRADWGFSCFVETPRAPGILFDTGANGSVLLHNMERLRLDPARLSHIFISHPHYDHMGGLSALLALGGDFTIYIPGSCPEPPGAKRVVRVTRETELFPDVFSTGELMGMEQSLVVRTSKGLVVITGCSHPGVGTILRSASAFGKVYALIGGLHGFRDFELLEDLDLILPCHCTRFREEIKLLYPSKCEECGVGKILEIGD